MLNVLAIDSALPLTERFDAKGIAIRPIAGTPLETLVRHSAVSDYDISPDTGQYATSKEIADLVARPCPVRGYNEHDIDRQELRKKVGEAVRNHLKFARTVVAPDVVSFVEAIQPMVIELSRNPLHEVEVVVSDAYPFLEEPALIDSIERSKDIPVDNVPMNFRHDTRTDEEILELMKTGSASLDQAIASFTTRLEPGALKHIWETMFTALSTGDGDNGMSFLELINQADKGITRSLVVFLVARKLWNNPTDDSNMTARQYEDLMVDYRDQAALSLLRARYRQQMAIDSGLLVESVSPNKITVNAAVYKDWIKTGGSNEVLLGLTLSSNPAMRVNTINENAQAYLAAWERHSLLSQATIRNRRFDRVKNLIEIEFGHYLTNLSENDISLQERPLIASRFQEALDSTRMDETEDIYGLVLRLLCAARYHQTDAEFILKTIDRVKRENPSIDVKEAATVATIEYTARWVGSQIKLETVTK